MQSAFTLRTGAAHWETLLRARAIETQSYVGEPQLLLASGAWADTKRQWRLRRWVRTRPPGRAMAMR